MSDPVAVSPTGTPVIPPQWGWLAMLVGVISPIIATEMMDIAPWTTQRVMILLFGKILPTVVAGAMAGLRRAPIPNVAAMSPSQVVVELQRGPKP